MNIFIDNNDLEEQYGEQKYKEYLEKENKQMKQDITTMNKEIERLNNNWNELEKYTKKEIKKWKEEEKTENDYSARANILGYITGMENVQDKIQKFKGVDKE